MDDTHDTQDMPQAQDSAEDLLEHDLQSFISMGYQLTQSVVLPAELRARIAEAVIAAKGCQVCHIPLGALHTLSCTLGGRERDTVKPYDLPGLLEAPPCETGGF